MKRPSANLWVQLGYIFLIVFTSQAIFAGPQGHSCGQDLECLREKGSLKSYINDKVSVRIGQDLLPSSSMKIVDLESRWMIQVVYVVNKSIKMMGNQLPKETELTFFLLKNDVELMSVSAPIPFEWDHFGPWRDFDICKWHVFMSQLKTGDKVAGLTVDKGDGVGFFYTNGNLKALRLSSDGQAFFNGHKYGPTKEFLYFKRDGQEYSQAEIAHLKNSYAKKHPKVDDERDERFTDVCPNNDTVNFVPDSIYVKHLSIKD